MKANKPDFQSAISFLKSFNYSKETESSWLAINTNINILNDLMKTSQEANFVLDTLNSVIQTSMLSDRSRLSGSSLSLLKSCAQKGANMSNYLHFIPPLFKLVNRPSKVFNQRAEEVLLLICNLINIDKCFLLFKEAFRSANKNVRLVVIRIIKHSKHPVLRELVEKARNDASIEVRSEVKDAYSPLKKIVRTNSSRNAAEKLESKVQEEKSMFHELHRKLEISDTKIPVAELEKTRDVHADVNTRHIKKREAGLDLRKSLRSREVASRGEGDLYARKEITRSRLEKGGDNLTPRTLSRYLKSYKESSLNKEAERSLMYKIKKREEMMSKLETFMATGNLEKSVSQATLYRKEEQLSKDENISLESRHSESKKNFHNDILYYRNNYEALDGENAGVREKVEEAIKKEDPVLLVEENCVSSHKTQKDVSELNSINEDETIQDEGLYECDKKVSENNVFFEEERSEALCNHIMRDDAMKSKSRELPEKPFVLEGFCTSTDQYLLEKSVLKNIDEILVISDDKMVDDCLKENREQRKSWNEVENTKSITEFEKPDDLCSPTLTEYEDKSKSYDAKSNLSINKNLDKEFESDDNKGECGEKQAVKSDILNTKSSSDTKKPYLNDTGLVVGMENSTDFMCQVHDAVSEFIITDIPNTNKELLDNDEIIASREDGVAVATKEAGDPGEIIESIRCKEKESCDNTRQLSDEDLQLSCNLSKISLTEKDTCVFMENISFEDKENDCAENSFDDIPVCKFHTECSASRVQENDCVYSSDINSIKVSVDTTSDVGNLSEFTEISSVIFANRKTMKKK